MINPFTEEKIKAEEEAIERKKERKRVWFIKGRRAWAGYPCDLGP